MTQEISDSKVIALALNALIGRRLDRRFIDIFVEGRRRLSTLDEPGWKVFFVFENENSFLENSLTVEVGVSGKVEISQSL